MIYKYLNEESIIIEDCVLTEEVNRLEKVSDAKVPKDFAKTISDIMSKIEENTGKRTGEGVATAGLGTYRIFSKNAKEKLLNKELKANYVIVVPLKHIFLNSKNEASRVDSLIEKSIISLGYKKGGAMAGNWKGYYYKKGQNKTIYVLAWWKVNNNQMQIQNLCVEDSEDNLNFIKANHNGSSARNESTNIFSSIELL